MSPTTNAREEKQMALEKLKSMDKDDFLHMLGLETRRTTGDYLIPALALFGVGVLVGTGIGLLVAPRPGRQLRQDIAHRIQQAPAAAAQVAQRTGEALHRGGTEAERLSEEMSNGVP